MPIYTVATMTSASLVLSTEAAGAAAFRAGLALDDNPHRAPCDTTALPLDDRDRRALEEAWVRGWDRERVVALCTESQGAG